MLMTWWLTFFTGLRRVQTERLVWWSIVIFVMSTIERLWSMSTPDGWAWNGLFIEQYSALKSYFLSEGLWQKICCNRLFIISLYYAGATAPRFDRLQLAFTKPMTEIYLLFYQAVLQTFVNFNKFLQREDPLIPVISEPFLTKLASKFLPVSAIKAVTEDFTRLKYNEVIDQLPGRHIIYKLCPKIKSILTV